MLAMYLCIITVLCCEFGCKGFGTVGLWSEWPRPDLMGLGGCCVKCMGDRLTSWAYWNTGGFLIEYCFVSCVFFIGGFL